MKRALPILLIAIFAFSAVINGANAVQSGSMSVSAPHMGAMTDGGDGGCQGDECTVMPMLSCCSSIVSGCTGTGLTGQASESAGPSLACSSADSALHDQTAEGESVDADTPPPRA